MNTKKPTIEKQTEIKKKRGNPQNLKPCKPGETHNPNGRPKLENTFSHIAREMLQSKKIDITYTFPKNGRMVTSTMHMEADKTMHHSLAAVLIKEGMAGNVKAIQEIIDRTEGRPKQSVDVTTKDESLNERVKIEDLSVDALKKVSDAILAIRR